LTFVLATVGDLVDDIVVRMGGPIQFASDTDAVIERRRGGSAANVAAVAARISGGSRFLGQVGDDALGDRLLAELVEDGVDVGCVRRRGRSGSIVVLVDSSGERTFLTDPGGSRTLDVAEEDWLDGIDVLHVPLYSLTGGAIATTVEKLVRWAHWRSIAVSIDLSSVSVIESLGVHEVHRVLAELSPDVVFANADEARAMNVDSAIGGAITIVKRGAGVATVFRGWADPVEVPATAVEDVGDTTGAGDAFAAGFLTYRGWRDDPESACREGHRAAAVLLSARNRP
jgi:sugar/nucleoside kinase (ribokinase family)